LITDALSSIILRLLLLLPAVLLVLLLPLSGCIIRCGVVCVQASEIPSQGVFALWSVSNLSN